MSQAETIVKLEKLVHGGQALARLTDGRAVFVWGGLPGEKVQIQLLKQKKDYAEGVVEEVIKPSPERITPKDAAYLSTSPWQVMTIEAEQREKQDILVETLKRAGVAHQDDISVRTPRKTWQYRNKMEYSFYGDAAGLHLALFKRGTHRKQIVERSSLAMPAVDDTANRIRLVLADVGVRAGSLKTLIVRADQKGNTTAALFVKDENFPKIKDLAAVCQGLVVYYSTPKSPASVLTKELYRHGETILQDELLGHTIRYDVTSFFQVNIDELLPAASTIAEYMGVDGEVVDFYAGVGTFAAIAGASKMVELDSVNIQLARRNVAKSCEVVHASAEHSLEHIPTGEHTGLIVDPPRAGLHKNVIQQIRQKQPDRIAYLSCNPVTQARDLALLQDRYAAVAINGYNFFPRTPHIESLTLLERK